MALKCIRRGKVKSNVSLKIQLQLKEQREYLLFGGIMYGEKSINNPRVTPKQQVYKTEDHGNWTELWTEEFYQHSDQIVPGHIFVTIALTAHLASIFHTLEYLPV